MTVGSTFMAPMVAAFKAASRHRAWRMPSSFLLATPAANMATRMKKKSMPKACVLFRTPVRAKSGDMEFVRGNRAILDHSNDGRALHLFQSLGKGKGQRYLGEFVYAGHKFMSGPDRNKDSRRLIVFRLVGVADAHAIEDAVGEEEGVHTAISMTLADARRIALAAAAGGAMPAKESAARTLYVRSKAVRDYVLMRAAGRCESCDQPAPFIRKNGTPYLEPHHTTRVSDGGPDHPRFVRVVCPACHRELHFGVGGEAKNAALQERLRALEPD